MLSVQDLEVQNIELEEANQKLQKELSVLRTLAKEAIMEKKKSQTALETLKHQVVHLLGEHDMVPKQESAKKKEGEKQEAPTPASTGDSCSSISAAMQFFWQTSVGLDAVHKLSVKMLAVMLQSCVCNCESCLAGCCDAGGVYIPLAV